jgi:hypothetical protein
MEAVKKTRVKRSGNQLILTLPDTFTAEEVDVLIWPSNEDTGAAPKNLSADLLQWPEMTDEELSLINEKRKHLNAWK